MRFPYVSHVLIRHAWRMLNLYSLRGFCMSQVTVMNLKFAWQKNITMFGLVSVLGRPLLCNVLDPSEEQCRSVCSRSFLFTNALNSLREYVWIAVLFFKFFMNFDFIAISRKQ